MITGAHIIVYSKDPEADRAFFRDTLKFTSVDAGHGWQPGYGIRDAMGRWAFGEASRQMTKATDVLATRDQIAFVKS